MSEKQEQAAIVDLLRTLGGQVYVLGTTRRRGDYPGTMQSPGLPDLVAFLPARGVDGRDHGRLLLFIECKAPGGRLRPEQQTFRDDCNHALIPHLVGGLDDVITWLEANDYPIATRRRA